MYKISFVTDPSVRPSSYILYECVHVTESGRGNPKISGARSANKMAFGAPVYKVILAGKRGVGKSTLYEYLVRNIETGGGTQTSFSLPESSVQQWVSGFLTLQDLAGLKESRYQDLVKSNFDK